MAEEMTFPNENFADEIDFYGYKLTLEFMALQLVHQNPDKAKENMRKLLEELVEKNYDRGVEVGLSLGSQFND